MPRPSIQDIPQSTSSSRLLHLHRPDDKLHPIFAQLTFHVLPGKLDGELDRIYSTIDELGGRCVSLEEARLVVTALRGRPRLEKALGKDMVSGMLVGDAEW